MKEYRFCFTKVRWHDGSNVLVQVPSKGIRKYTTTGAVEGLFGVDLSGKPIGRVEYRWYGAWALDELDCVGE